MVTEYQHPVLDRELFFGNPVITGGQLSPDGQYISFIKPLDGMMNIWVKRKNEPMEAALPVTNDRNRPVRSYFWSRDSEYILYIQDKGGDENFHLYAVAPKDATDQLIPDARDLTPYDGIRAFILDLPRVDEDLIYVGLNDRDPAWHDYYAISISTGERVLLFKNDQSFSAVYFDLSGRLRLASRSTPDAGTELFHIKGKEQEKILYASMEESIQPLKFRNNSSFYYISNAGNPDLMGLYVYDLESNEEKFVESDPEAYVDLEEVLFSQATDEPVGTVYIGNRKKIYWKNPRYQEAFNYLKRKFSNSEVSILSVTGNDNEWLIQVYSDINPGQCWYFDIESKTLDILYTPRPELPVDSMVSMSVVTYPSLDGLEIPAYLSVPAVKEPAALPAVILPHGGPWARDYWGYHSWAQFLANRGYVVLQPNFRGSTGYGKAFLNAAINEWGEKMQDDLTAGARYLVEKGYADPDRIGIMGGSYGGYATLAGLTFTPEVYAAGVSIVGPSNLFTLLETIPPYWETARQMFHRRMGDPTTEEGRAQLKRQSPLFHAKNIRSPLLVAQGANDPRVKKSESDQIVQEMHKLGLDVTYLNFPDEGHGFANPKNNMAFIAAMEAFLARHLGGRYQSDISDELSAILDNARVEL